MHEGLFNNNRGAHLVKKQKERYFMSVVEERRQELMENEYIKQSYKRRDICGFWTLIDQCQYWDGGQTGYFLALNVFNENFVNIYLMKEVDDETIERVVAMRYVLDGDIKRVTEDLWMCSQHLYIDRWDGRNVPWTRYQALEWLTKKYSKHISIVVDQGQKEIKL